MRAGKLPRPFLAVLAIPGGVVLSGPPIMEEM